MVTTKYCIDIRTKSKTCRQTENGYYEVFSNTSIPKAKQRTKMVTTTCIIRAHQKQGLKQVKQTYRNRLLRCIVLYINTISKNHKRGSPDSALIAKSKILQTAQDD
jgi:hypothetical protein